MQISTKERAMTTTADTTTTVETGLTGDYDIDPTHSRIGFAAKHAMVANVRGQFAGYRADVHLDEENPDNSSVRLEIDAATVDSRNADRDAHLRNADFFDVDNYPTIVFQSTKVEKTDDDDVYTLIGDLTIKDQTRPVAVEFELTGTTVDPWGNFRAGFEGRTTVSRRDWGLEWNMPLDKGGVLVSEKVKLEFDIAAVRKTETTA
jgi:polyisoprenoid-binding protein YceI